MLKAFFDSSRDEKYGRCISLAGIVSSEAIWPEFEKQWMAVLESYGLEEFHMTDAMAIPPQGEFKGWTERRIKSVLNDLVNTVAKFAGRESLPKGKEFLLKACTVKMEDYFKVKAENIYLRRPEAICVNSCCGTGLPPDPANPGAEYQSVIFYFDHNEPYLRHIKNNWDRGKKYRVGWPSQVKDILPISATNVPALQAVDILAWTANHFHMGDDRARSLFFIIPLSGGIHDFYDYETIKKEYGNDKKGTDPYAYKARP
jgi:Protein of unknown function (DUF3800)